MGYKIKYKNQAGNRGYGIGEGGGGVGGGGDDEASAPTTPRLPLSPQRLPRSPPPTLPSSDPRALAASPLPLQPPRPPPRAADQDTDGGSDNGESREEENDELEANKEPFSALVQEHSNLIIREKIEILSQHYARFRRNCEESSCFYRAFLFSYLENLGQMQDRQGEVTRLMEHVDMSKERFCSLNWDEAYLSNPEEYFTSLMAEFNDLVNSAANGLSSHDVIKSCLQAIRSPRKTDIRTRGGDYRLHHPDNFDVLPYCCNKVRPMGAEPTPLVIRAVTYALGIPLRVETVDRGLVEGVAKVRRFDFFPDHSDAVHWSSSRIPTPLEVASGNLLSSDGTPLLTLMCMQNLKRDPKPWYILYRE